MNSRTLRAGSSVSMHAHHTLSDCRSSRATKMMLKSRGGSCWGREIVNIENRMKRLSVPVVMRSYVREAGSAGRDGVCWNYNGRSAFKTKYVCRAASGVEVDEVVEEEPDIIAQKEAETSQMSIDDAFAILEKEKGGKSDDAENVEEGVTFKRTKKRFRSKRYKELRAMTPKKTEALEPMAAISMLKVNTLYSYLLARDCRLEHAYQSSERLIGIACRRICFPTPSNNCLYFIIIPHSEIFHRVLLRKHRPNSSKAAKSISASI